MRRAENLERISGALARGKSVKATLRVSLRHDYGNKQLQRLRVRFDVRARSVRPDSH